MKIKTLNRKKNWKGVKVLLRVDFNLPVKNGHLESEHRLASALPSIKFLLDKGVSLIIATHWGDPKQKDLSLSTKKLANKLRKVSGLKIKFVNDIVGDKALRAARNLKDGEIIFLENLRFHPGEKKNDKKFAQQLASLADVYVNEAFSVCHREQASIASVPQYLPSFAGLQLVSEIRNLEKIVKAKKPFVIVMGGAKISTKAPLIKKMYKQTNKILIGGALANNFFKYQNLEIGKSFFDQNSRKYIKDILEKDNIRKKIILPVDLIVKDRQGNSQHRLIQGVKKSDTILDIGPNTIALFSVHIKKAQTIVWNGPLGKFEDRPYKHGTIALGAIIAARSTGRAFGLVGGGETVSALKLTQMEGHIDWISTAGGAMLAYLGGEDMPGLRHIFS